MKSKIIFGALIASTIVLTGSCKKDPPPEDTKIGGCSDPDSPLYNANADYDDNSCQYAFTSSYEITSHPEKDANGDDWDFLTYTDADLYVIIKEEGSTTELFHSTTIEDQPHNSPATWTAPASIKLLNKNYTFEVYDEDTGSSDDFVGSGTFNPIELANSGTITATGTNSSGDQTVFKIYYELKTE